MNSHDRAKLTTITLFKRYRPVQESILIIEQAIEAAVVEARASEQREIRGLIQTLRETTCDGGESKEEHRLIGGTCSVIDAAIRARGRRHREERAVVKAGWKERADQLKGKAPLKKVKRG